MPALTHPVTADDHSIGPKSAEYTLVEYADLQCPDTAMAEPELSELMERLDGRLRLVFRHFPLTDLHPNAYAAAEAVEAAGEQGKFWEMRQQLLDHQDQLDHDSIRSYAERLGLDMERFEKDISQHKFAKHIEKDVQSGTGSGVEGTPTFFLNESMLDPGLDLFEVFDALEDGEESEDEDDEI